MTPDHVRGRLSSDAGVTSSSIISPTIPPPISTLSTAPFMMLSPASTTSDNLIHRRFPYGLLRSGVSPSAPAVWHNRRSGISRLTNPTAVDQPLLRARSSCPRTDLGVRSEGSKVEWVTSSARSRYRRNIRDAEGARKHYGAACP